MVNVVKTTQHRELKLVFADQNLAETVFSLMSCGPSIGDYRFVPRSEEVHQDIYFDTATRALQRAHASLRLRRVSGGDGVLQCKKPMGDVAVGMAYVTLECENAWSDSTTAVSLVGEIGEAVVLYAGDRDLFRVGLVAMTRRILVVKKLGREVAEVCLDRFVVSQQGGTESIENAEVEIKGPDEHELLHLGESLANWFGLIRVTSSKLERHIPLQRPAERLLLDMDPGVDDALALLYLFAQPRSAKLEGITIVGGNVSVAKCARNAYRICRWAQDKGLITEIPTIATGIDLSKGRSNAANVHGCDGLGDLDWGRLDQESADRTYPDAYELQKEVLLASPGKVTVVGTGPCSNLAELIKRDSQALANAREIIIMGGAFFDCGNRGPQAEFNIHSDSVAARKVLEYCRLLVPNGPKSFRERVPLSFVGLDVTHRAILERRMLQEISSPLSKLAAGISSKYMDFYRMVLGIDGCPLHDPLAIALALHPEYLVREPYHVEIVSTPQVSETDGITIADHRPCALFKDRLKEVTQVCVSVNAKAFMRDFLGNLATS